MEQNTCSYEGPIEKLQTASFLIKQVLEETPEIYWQYARSNLVFPTIILRPPKHFKEQVEIFREKGVLSTGSGRARDPDNEFNHAVDLAYSELLSIKYHQQSYLVITHILRIFLDMNKVGLLFKMYQVNWSHHLFKPMI